MNNMGTGPDQTIQNTDPLALPHKKAFSSKTKTIRHVSLAWQAMKLHETFGLAKMERQDVVSMVSTSHKRNGPHDNKRTKAPITLNSWTQTKEMCNLGTFPPRFFPPISRAIIPPSSMP